MKKCLLKNRKNDKVKFKIYFLEIDLSYYLYGVYNYMNSMINQFFKTIFQKVF